MYRLCIFFDDNGFPVFSAENDEEGELLIKKKLVNFSLT